MDIIVLGNGYDLAHGLPTRYVDFLDFINLIMDMSDKDLNNKINKHIIENINNCLKNPEDKILGELMDLIRDNFWIDHFNKEKMKKKENWIDFENEISNVIQSIDEHIKDNPDISINNCIITNIKDFIPMNFSTERKTYAEFRDKLLKDLNNFIRCFEI